MDNQQGGRLTQSELEALLIKLIGKLMNLDLSNMNWDNFFYVIENWNRIKEVIDRIMSLPELPDWIWNLPSQPPATPGNPQPPSFFNWFAVVFATRVSMTSIQEGGRFEARPFLAGWNVLVTDDLPPSMWYCDGIKWRRSAANINTDFFTVFGNILDPETRLAKVPGETATVPLSAITPLNDSEAALGKQVSDIYHAVGIIIKQITPEFDPTISEPHLVIMTWIPEADGNTLFINDPDYTPIEV